MINNPKLIKELLDKIKNTSKEDLDKAIEEVEKELKEDNQC